MSDSVTTTLHKYALMALGVPATPEQMAALRALYDQAGDFTAVDALVNDYMDSRAATLGGASGLVAEIAANGLGLTLSDDEAQGVYHWLTANGFDTWTEVFSFCATLNGDSGTTLTTRAAVAEIVGNALDTAAEIDAISSSTGHAAVAAWLSGINHDSFWLTQQTQQEVSNWWNISIGQQETVRFAHPEVSSLVPNFVSDGHYETFAGPGGTLVIGESNGVADIFFRDILADTIAWTSTGTIILESLPPAHSITIWTDGFLSDSGAVFPVENNSVLNSTGTVLLGSGTAGDYTGITFHQSATSLAVSSGNGSPTDTGAIATIGSVRMPVGSIVLSGSGSILPTGSVTAGGLISLEQHC